MPLQIGKTPIVQIHYAGQYLSTKEVQQQFTKAILKKKFRAEHSKELDAYAESVKYFREENDGKLPSLKSLKKRKEKLTQEIAESNHSKLIVDELAAENVQSIFCWKISGMSNQGIADRLNAKKVQSPAARKLQSGAKLSLHFRKSDEPLWSERIGRKIYINPKERLS